ncbi:MAG: PQQ-binding-like beta-propeller repeat protein, partial [Planctomycetes bacterium]|nr:PQQ-binding-like beta-propeller repeat protein [Planctomycetota bacterium]
TLRAPAAAPEVRAEARPLARFPTAPSPLEIRDYGVGKSVNPLSMVFTRGLAIIHDGLFVRGVAPADGGLSAWYVANYLPVPIDDSGAEDPNAYAPFGLAVAGDLAVSLHRERSVVAAGRLPRYTLRAWDVAAEGKRLWDTADVADPRSRAFYAEITFTGSPIVDGDRIYAGALEPQMDVRAWLVCLHAQTGRLLWASRLCAEQMENDVTAVPSGLSPVKAGGRVYFCSNQGAVGAFDALTGDLEWVSAYALNTSSRERAPGGGSSDRWADNPPVVIGNALYVTPQDSDHLWIFDTESGLLLRQIERVNGHDRYTWMAAGSGERVFLAGQRASATGKADDRFGLVLPIRGDRREVETLIPEPPIGRPGVCGDVLFVPTAKGLRRVEPRGRKSPDPRLLVTFARPPGTGCIDVLAVDGWFLLLSSNGVLRGYPATR